MPYKTRSVADLYELAGGAATFSECVENYLNVMEKDGYTLAGVLPQHHASSETDEDGLTMRHHAASMLIMHKP